jgi:LytS/YehU family sensor histidine kinase
MADTHRMPGKGPEVHRGLTAEVARRIAAIVYRIAAVDAVAITDADHILAYAGHGCPYMQPGMPVQTDATRRVLRTGTPEAVENKEAMHCPVAGCPCPVNSAVIAPLKAQGAVVGTVKLYRQESGQSPAWLTRLALGMSELLSLHIELEEAERERELLVQARLEALVAQIRPHFLFNTLNTIIATSRRDPDQARELLVELARFLRHTLDQMGDRVTVARDLEVVDLYLRLEQARFGDRIQVRMHVDPECLNREIPVLTLEPLVENAVVHGLAPKEGPGRINVRVKCRRRHMLILVADDGVGMPASRLAQLFGEEPMSAGVGLANVHERLVRWWGNDAGLRVRSRPGRGTVVLARLPHRLPAVVAR